MRSLALSILLAVLTTHTARADEGDQCTAQGGTYLTGQVMSAPTFAAGHEKKGVELSHTHLTLRSDQDGQSYDVAIDNVFASGYDDAGEAVPAPISAIVVGDHLDLCGTLYSQGVGIHFVHTNCRKTGIAGNPDGWLKIIAKDGTPGPDLEGSREYCRLWSRHAAE